MVLTTTEVIPDRPRTRTELVYQGILRMILAGELSPGEPLRETELAARLKVSRTPIREALGRLSEYGVVQIRPNAGAEVRRLGPGELAQIHEVREALEGLAADRACGRLRPEDFERLDDLAEACRVEEQTPAFFERFDAFDLGLHRTIAERSGNPILAREIVKLHRLTMLIHEQLEWVLLNGRPGPAIDRRAIRRLAWRQHVGIVDALRSGDPDASRRAMVDHVRSQCTFKLQLMPDPSPDGPGP